MNELEYNTLFINGFPEETKEDDIRSFFKDYDIKSIVLSNTK